MTDQKNPFVELYITEHISADKFVEIFSPVLVEESDTHALFQPGNVILTGLQGSGKTALLNLLKPEVLIAYKKSKKKWPLPNHCAKFISAGINLAKSSAMDFGQRTIDATDENNNKIFALFFADFLNYWIVSDLLSTIDTLRCDSNYKTRKFLSLNISDVALDEFAKYVSSKNCWFGWLNNVNSYKELKVCVDNRIIDYRNFLNYNGDLPKQIQTSKTSPGEPIGVVAEALKFCGLIPNSLPVFIRIDQFESLMGIKDETDGTLSKEFRGVIMKMLGMRDDRISYRVGARPYSFHPDFVMFGTESSAEEMRNFKIVDIEKVLRGYQSQGSLFPKFCNDVFIRRLKDTGYQTAKTKQSPINFVFGPRALPKDKALRYAKTNPFSIIGRSDSWPHGMQSELQELAKKNPLSAKLGEAWLRQKSAKQPLSIDEMKRLPWENRKWWKKERIQQALLQISASRQQKMVWYGGPDVIALSGRNILVFISICQFTWAEYMRTCENNSIDLPESIDTAVQNMGIQEASSYWFRKVKADPNGGDDRHRFLNVLGQLFRIKLRDDKHMSYPGTNGFSLSLGELEKNRMVAEFLDMCVAYGALESFRHTPKTKSRGQSRKWYLFPILTPYFQLPTPHTKEPFYARVDDVLKWMRKADVIGAPIRTSQNSKNKTNSLQQSFSFNTGADE